MDEGRIRENGDGAQAVRRALHIARTVAQLQKTGATLARVTRATGLHRATVFRILRSLTDERLLRFREVDRSYHVGALAFELGLAAGSEPDVREDWRPMVEDIASTCGLTSYLMARSGDEAVCLLCVQARAAVRAMPIDVGQRVPLGIGAGGLVMLAALDDDEIRRIATAHEDRLQLFPARALNPEQIGERVAETRRRGFSISRSTVAQGVCGVGVLIPDMLPHVRMAVTVSAVTDDIGETEAAALASAIRAGLGRHGHSHRLSHRDAKP